MERERRDRERSKAEMDLDGWMDGWLDGRQKMAVGHIKSEGRSLLAFDSY